MLPPSIPAGGASCPPSPIALPEHKPAEPLPLLAPRRCDPGPSSFLQVAQEPAGNSTGVAQEPDLTPYILGLFALLLVPRMLQSTGAKATKSVVFSHRTALYWPALF